MRALITRKTLNEWEFLAEYDAGGDPKYPYAVYVYKNGEPYDTYDEYCVPKYMSKFNERHFDNFCKKFARDEKYRQKYMRAKPPRISSDANGEFLEVGDFIKFPTGEVCKILEESDGYLYFGATHPFWLGRDDIIPGDIGLFMLSEQNGVGIVRCSDVEQEEVSAMKVAYVRVSKDGMR